MRYVGGKGKIAKNIAREIAVHTQHRTIYEPFMGGGAMTAALAPQFDEVIAGDAHEDIALMWRAVLDGWEPYPVDYEEYQQLRYSDTPSPIRGFAGAGCSFGGRWFGGFARGGTNADGTPRNHQAESARAVLRDRDKMLAGNVSVFHKGYQAWPWDCIQPSAIYCDPPYSRSLGAKLYQENNFDTAEFWDWANDMSENHDVFVSEYEAPDGWVPIWEATKRQSLVIGSGDRGMRTERLYVRATPVHREAARALADKETP